MKIVIIGATGLIGNELVHDLLQNSSKIDLTTITRKKIQIENDQLNQIIYPDLSIKTLSSLQLSADHFICCLGTTIKQARTKENFKAVDLDLAVEFASLAKRSSAKSFHVVSSKGANSDSLFFYNRVKGEMEEEVKSISIPSVYIYRPSLLIGDRQEKRTGEKIGINSYHLLKRFLPNNYKNKLVVRLSLLSKKWPRTFSAIKMEFTLLSQINFKDELLQY